jgi:hypothetical protein
MSITVNTTTVKTHNALLPDIILAANAVYTLGAIGDKKTLLLACTFVNPDTTGTNSLVGKEVIFNPALFISAGFYPDQSGAGYYIAPYSSMSSGTPYEMALFGNGSYQSVNQNWKCYYIPSATVGDFSIQLEFYLTADINGFISGLPIQNNDRLLKNNITNSDVLDNSDASVYNGVRQLLCYINVQFVVEGSLLVDSIFHPVNFNLRFFDSGLNAGASEFTDPRLELLDSTGADTTKLSTYEITTVKMYITGAPNAVAAWLIRTDTANNNKTFYANYEASFTQLTTTGSSAIINNNIQGPVTALAVVGGEKETTFNIAPANLDFNGTYRIIALYYDGGSLVNSFISGEILADAYPPGCSPDFTGSLKCYNRTYGDYITAAPLDRIKSTITIDGLDLATCIANYWTGFISIWAYFARLDITFYTLDGTTRTIVDSAYIDQVGFSVGDVGPYQYNLVNKSNNLDIDAEFTTNADGEATIETTFRIRDEATNTWVGKTVYLEYKLTLNYYNAPNPYYDAITYTQKIDVREYENSSGTIIESVKYKNAVSGNYTNVIIPGNSYIVEAKLFGAVADSYNLLALLDKQVFGLANVIEEESYASVRLDQLTNDTMSAVDVTYDAVTKIASFTIDTNELDSSLLYSVIALAKKV